MSRKMAKRENIQSMKLVHETLLITKELSKLRNLRIEGWKKKKTTSKSGRGQVRGVIIDVVLRHEKI